MLSLGATWISDQPRYRWKAFLLLMITALLLLTNMFTQRFMARDEAHMHVADIVEKGYKKHRAKVLHHAVPYVYFMYQGLSLSRC